MNRVTPADAKFTPLAGGDFEMTGVDLRTVRPTRLYPQGIALPEGQSTTQTLWSAGDFATTFGNAVTISVQTGLWSQEVIVADPIDTSVPTAIESVDIPLFLTQAATPSLGVWIKICDTYQEVLAADPCAGTVLYNQFYEIINTADGPLPPAYYTLSLPVLDGGGTPTPLVLDDRVGGGVDIDGHIVIEFKWTLDDQVTIVRGAAVGALSMIFSPTSEVPGTVWDIGASTTGRSYRDQNLDSVILFTGAAGGVNDWRGALNGIGSKWYFQLTGSGSDSVVPFTYGTDLLRTTGCSSFTVPPTTDPGDDPAEPQFPFGFGSFDTGDGGEDCTGDNFLNSDAVPAGTVFSLTGAPVASVNINDPTIPLGAGVDTVLERRNSAKFSGGGTRGFLFNMRSLGVTTSVPFTVTRGGGAEVETWNMLLGFSDAAQVTQGPGTYTASTCSSNTGDATFTAGIVPKIRFTRVSGGNGPCQVTYDFGPLGVAGWTLSGSGPYAGALPGQLAATGAFVEPGGVYRYDSNFDGLFTELFAWGMDGGNSLGTKYACDDCSTTDLVLSTVSIGGNGLDLLLKPSVPFDTDGDGDTVNDSDSDGDADLVVTGADNCPSTANGCQEDGDVDGAGDACDNCPLDCNADQADGDGDGAGDACDTCPNDPGNDADGDGVCGDVDNCPAAANTDQLDTDGDTQGDACDPCPNDATNDGDADGVCENVDNCPGLANADQANADGDAQGNACDPCPNDATNDADGDGVCEDVDNCPGVANPDQTDTDGDGPGDACDPPGEDADGDGVQDDDDNCPNNANANQLDQDGDGFGDVCDACPRSDLRAQVWVGRCNSKAGNDLLADGCTIADKIAACRRNNRHRHQYVACVVSLLLNLKHNGTITGREFSKILKCALRKKDHDSDHRSRSDRDDHSDSGSRSRSNSRSGRGRHDDDSSDRRNRNHGQRGRRGW